MGTRPRHWSMRPPRPRLFLLVYGATLVLLTLTMAGLALLVSEHLTASATRAIVNADQAIVRGILAEAVGTADLARPGSDQAAVTRLQAAIGELVDGEHVIGVRVVSTAGSVLASDRPEERGSPAAPDARLASAFAGHHSAELIPAGSGDGRDGPVLSEYWPLVINGSVGAVVELRRDGAPIVRDAVAIRRDVALVTGSAALLVAVLLYLIFRGAQLRLARQTRELLESTRRDALTGLLNHGAVVDRLAEALNHARADNSAVGIALVDVDNFRLLNDVHGHAAGDMVLTTLVRAIEQDDGSWAAVGRYGPDEFLLVSNRHEARDVEPRMKRLRSRLDAMSVRFGRSERLPVTVSVGVAHFPFHADAVTQLLSEATIALGEAKGSGGDAVRVAGAWDREPGAARSSFDILQGLVIAVDTKDRYTKRHSEDVARYALFLADQLGLDEKIRETIRLAGLLHDVGKIGIPDDILRKPGELTPYEYEIVKQHVALGDLIVRDVPNLAIVRAGIRHHHERWDGTGYLDRLSGEDIPLIARILAVGDAFSAMTTTRPYRKALPVETALRRLEDASATQLDPRLVRTFTQAIETVPDAPLPGADAPPVRAWTPHHRTAVGSAA